ncbi:hypothetical protein [Pseudonocardia sp. ICBG1293]|uniref:hypothetical protein n=1 Tax=Pseudonocardia sp. ICBG1293 TaxID=2844382 RepID=UPI001CCB7AC3|nr:hypothetical protein [Pseudonocardia sp. ICBG1293]
MVHVRQGGACHAPSARVRALLAGTAAAGEVAAAAGAGGPPELRWAAAVAWGGSGYYAAAASLLDGVRRDPAAGVVVRAHATLTRASHLRQLGGHRAAAALDGDALRLMLPGAGHPADPGPWGLHRAAAVADALTGLAADALGRLDAGTAALLLGRAEPWCGPPGHRTRVRYGWVAAETALVARDVAGALAAADAALAGAVALGSARHVLKSRLVRAVAAGVAGADRTAVGAELDAVAADALAHGLLPLHRPALLARADLAGPQDVPVCDGGGPDVVPDRPRHGRPGADRGTPDAGSGPVVGARHAGASPFDTRSRRADAEGRRHAVLHTVSVLSTRSDRSGRDLLRE